MRTDPSATPSPPQRRWTLWLAGLLALGWAGALVLADLLGQVMGSWDSPAPGLPWIRTGIVGQCVLAVVALVALGVGVSSPSWFRTARITAWTLIPVEFAWFLLTARLAAAA